MKRPLGFVLALVVLGGVAYVLFPYLRTGQTQMAIEIPAGIEVTAALAHEESATHFVDVEYPQFGLSAIDADIKGKIDMAVDEFKAVPAGPPGSTLPQYSFEGAYDSVYVGPDVVSAVLTLSQYTGGAHPMTILSGLNYDRATGRQLLPEDAFRMIGMTVEEVSARATLELKAKLGDMMFEEGANSNPENFSSFIISEDEVTFIFQPYQVAAYAAGVQEVSFERKE